MQLSERAGEAILNEIVGRGDIARQRARIAPQARNLGFDAAMDFALTTIPSCSSATGAGADPERAKLSDGPVIG